ncbi:ABC transporter permease [Cellulomonas fengjieae]|uniref:ABC transporter permease n=1 Tax=Cellulomonas fengjieae TaxID=2819978 RepID=A0ABS3SJU4_9CELL|nr:ABC transporter permease [Cellulomonas fengjieae]MBO3085235.1 ABC transporter permease [Cellulomonas fengjieae]MBO3100982.1 ABC transporter permease [Cellulomonas fengjieae]QVI66199.1 ABC transporter permease [Cellulomonas fengjieae]
MTTTAAPPASTTHARPEGRIARAVRTVGVQNLSLVAAIIVLVVAIGSQNSAFFLASNLKTIGMAVTISGLLALVQTVVIIMGGIDLSVGSVAGLASVTSAMVFMNAGAPASIAAALAVGAVCGLISGCIVVFGRVTPMIATLAALIAYKGVAQLVSNGRAQGYTGADSFYVFLARGTLLGVPTLIWVLVLVAALIHVMLSYTRMGRNIYAVGGNDTAARLSGVNINRYILGVFVLSGTIAALAGILITARTGSGQPVSGSEGLEFQSITAAALGGVALRGGKGSIGGTILAVILLGILLNGMSLLGVNPFWQNVAQGTLLVAAVVIQQVRNGERRVGLPK